jgi:putative inorganic carbon (hco3(-)) transporter
MTDRLPETHAVGLPLGTAGQLNLREESPSVYSVPFLLILTYFFVDYGRPQDWFPVLGAIRPAMIVLGVSIAVLFLSGRMVVPPLARLMLLFVALMAVMVPFSFNHRVAFYKTEELALLMFGAALPIIAFVDSVDRLKALIGFIVWIHVPMALFSLTHKGVGVGSFLTDENDFALAMNMVLPYAVALLVLARSTIRRVLLLGVITLFLAAIVGTMSRGGFIGLVSVAVMMWLRSRRKFRALIGVALLALIFALVARSQTSFGHHAEAKSYWDEMTTIQSATEEGDTGETRIELWGLAWRMFLDNPVLGVGPSNFPFNAANYETEYMASHGRHAWGRVAHSLYFTLLSESGTVGTLVFGCIVALGWAGRRRLERACRSAVENQALSGAERDTAGTMSQLAAAMDVALVTFLVTGAFLSVLYYPHLWLLTAMTAASMLIAKRMLPAVSWR